MIWSRVGVVVSLVAIVSCAPVPPSLIARGAARESTQPERAYTDYRAALHYQIPVDSPEFDATRERMERAFERWVKKELEVLRAAAAENPGGALDGLLALLVKGHGAVAWEDAEIKAGLQLLPTISDRDREAVTSSAMDVARRLIPEVDEAEKAGQLLLAAGRASTIAQVLPELEDRARQLRMRAAASVSKHAYAPELMRYRNLVAFHEHVARWLRGEPFGLEVRRIGFEIFGSSRCARLHRDISRTRARGDVVIPIQIADEHCEIVETRREGSERLIDGYREETTPSSQSCHYEANPGGIAGGYDQRGNKTGMVCSATTPSTKRVPIYKSVPYRYVDWHVRWSGRAVIGSLPGERRTIDLAIDLAGTSKAPASAGREPQYAEVEVQRELQKLGVFDSDAIRKARASLGRERAAEARRNGDVLGEDNAVIEELRWDSSEAGYEHLARRYQMSKHAVWQVFFGEHGAYRWPGALPIEASSRPPYRLEGEVPTACEMCVGSGKLPGPRGNALPLALAMGGSYTRTAEDAMIPDFGSSVAVRSALWQEPREHVGAIAGSLVELGAGTGGGFLYTLQASVGMGLRAGPLTLGVAGGGGFSGVTGDRIGFGWEVPVTARAALRVGSRLLLDAQAQAQWVFSEPAREAGSARAPFGDELRSTLGLHVIRPSFAGSRSGTSLYIGVDYREALGTNFLGVTVGMGTLR